MPSIVHARHELKYLMVQEQEVIVNQQHPKKSMSVEMSNSIGELDTYCNKPLLLAPVTATDAECGDTSDDATKTTSGPEDDEDGSRIECETDDRDANNEENNSLSTLDSNSISSAAVANALATEDAAAAIPNFPECNKKATENKRSVQFEPMSTMYVFDDDESSEGCEDEVEGDEVRAQEQSIDRDVFSCYSTNAIASPKPSQSDPSDSLSCNKYYIENAWYSANDIKAFRADAWLTVNWMVLNGFAGENMAYITGKHLEEAVALDSGDHPEQDELKLDSDTESAAMLSARVQQEKDQKDPQPRYSFCSRGVECRTPLGRIVKNKRRLDAMRAVLLYQQMQKNSRRVQRRKAIKEQQRSNSNKGYDNCNETDYDHLERLRRIEIEIDTEALANVYRSYCEESCSVALALGRQDALDAGIPKPPPIENRNSNPVVDSSPPGLTLVASSSDVSSSSSLSNSTSATSVTASVAPPKLPPIEPEFLTHRRSRSLSIEDPQTIGKVIVDCPSLCDDDDDDEEDLATLVSLSYVRHPIVEEYGCGEQDEEEEEHQKQGLSHRHPIVEEYDCGEQDEEEEEYQNQGLSHRHPIVEEYDCGEHDEEEEEHQKQGLSHRHPIVEEYEDEEDDDERNERSRDTTEEEGSQQSRASHATNHSSSFSVAISVSSDGCTNKDNSNNKGTIDVSVVEVTLHYKNPTTSLPSTVQTDDDHASNHQEIPHIESIPPSHNRDASLPAPKVWKSPSELLSCSSSKPCASPDATANELDLPSVANKPVAIAHESSSKVAHDLPSSPPSSPPRSSSFDRLLDVVSGGLYWW